MYLYQEALITGSKLAQHDGKAAIVGKLKVVLTVWHVDYRCTGHLCSYCRQIESGTDTSTTAVRVIYVAIKGKLKVVGTRQLPRYGLIT